MTNGGMRFEVAAKDRKDRKKKVRWAGNCGGAKISARRAVGYFFWLPRAGFEPLRAAGFAHSGHECRRWARKASTVAMRTERLKSGAFDPKELAKSWAHRDFRPTAVFGQSEPFCALQRLFVISSRTGRRADLHPGATHPLRISEELFQHVDLAL
jgi:hypothetical protein